MARVRLRLGSKAKQEPKQEKGDKGRFTVLIVPNDDRRFRKLQLTRPFVGVAMLAAGALLAAGLIAPHLYLRVQTQRASIEQLAAENSRLRDQTQQFESSVDRIQEQLSGIEETAGKLADELGVEMMNAPAGGPGAPTLAGRSPLIGELDSLGDRTVDISSSLADLDEAFQVRARLLSATPSIMPAQGWFSHGFGWRKDPFTGKRAFHRGVDIVNHRGTPIVSTADGVVTRAVRVADLGKTVDISHGRGFVTRYAHLSETLVKPGQKVRRGEVIGKMGSTGRSTGDHLHYEIFYDGRRVNPWKYLGRR